MYSLGVHESTNLNSMRNSIKLIESHGGRIVHVFPPHILIGNIPANIQAKDAGVKNIYHGIIDPAQVEDLVEEAVFAVNDWNMRFKAQAKIHPVELDQGLIKNDCIIWEPKEKHLAKSEFIPCHSLWVRTTQVNMGSTHSS